MAITHAPGAGLGPGDARPRGRRTAIIVGAVVLAVGAIVVPFGIRGLDRDGSRASAAPAQGATPPTSSPTTRPRVAGDPALGSTALLPALLPAARGGMHVGAKVLVGNVTTGVLQHGPNGVWQVAVQWGGHVQPLPTQGALRIQGGSASWLAADGTLYTRVPTGTAGRFQVYVWEPSGGSAYTPPTLVATAVGAVCFNAALTAYGDCHVG